jgi:hypothetical protein
MDSVRQIKKKGVGKVYYRNFRPVIGEYNSINSVVTDSRYAVKPSLYTRSFDLIQKDLLLLFEYIEPADRNLNTYSLRINDLLIRICTEIETNFKAILRENKFSKDLKFCNIGDYKLVNSTHHLSDYEITFPVWSGKQNTFIPFTQWTIGDKLFWYDAYNLCKHDKVKNLEKATMRNLLNSFAALFALLTAQFQSEDFSTGICLIGCENSYYKGEFGIGGYLIYKHNYQWSEEEKYDLDTNNLTDESFQKFDYDSLCIV